MGCVCSLGMQGGQVLAPPPTHSKGPACSRFVGGPCSLGLRRGTTNHTKHFLWLPQRHWQEPLLAPQLDAETVSTPSS
jgi:hypothetical protein